MPKACDDRITVLKPSSYREVSVEKLLLLTLETSSANTELHAGTSHAILHLQESIVSPRIQRRLYCQRDPGATSRDNTRHVKFARAHDGVSCQCDLALPGDRRGAAHVAQVHRHRFVGAPPQRPCRLRALT